MEMQLLIAASIIIVLLVGFMISALRILRDVLEGFGMTITDLRKYNMEGHSVMTISKAANISRQRVYIILNKGE